MIFKVTKLHGRHLPCRVRPHPLKDVLDRDIVPLKLARHDGAAVQHERGKVEARQRHHHAGDRLVAAGEADDTVKQVPARH